MPVATKSASSSCRSGDFRGGVSSCQRADDPVARPVELRIDAIRLVVVVLPLVPVTPTIVNDRLGWPKKLAASHPIARRVSATTI